MNEPHAADSLQQHRALRTVLVIGLVLALLGLCVWILRPFLPAAVWATMIVVASWPALLGLQKRLRGRRLPAAVLLTVALLLSFLLPLTLTLGTLIQQRELLVSGAQALSQLELGPPPAWLGSLPLVGPDLEQGWRDFVAEGDIGKQVAPQAEAGVRWLITRLGDMGMVIVQLLLTVMMVLLLYLHGEAAADLLLRCLHRLDPQRGEAAARLADQAIRGVALGVVGTAALQALAAVIGLLIAGVPFAGLLTALVFLFGVAQIGPLPVLFGAALWLHLGDSTGAAVALAVWAMLISIGESVLRPVLIRRTARLPLLLIFAGVVGGLLSFGLVGLFIGPIVLAVVWTNLVAWTQTTPPEPEPGEKSAGDAAASATG